ncbi:MAG TPA: CHASE3 domain-containing protein, partial [Chthoniobacterales bacterium]|nr:CHASE3 domain-containing protein [Chthoniobacterales bacterium]
MISATPPALESSATTGKGSIFRRGAAWLFSQQHFHVKLLSGTAAGVIVIVFLAGVFLFVTYRNHRQEVLRTHTVEVMRLSSVIENDIAALETGHRGFLLTGENSYLEAFDQRRELLKTRVDDLTALILESPMQRKRVMRVQEILQNWQKDIVLPEINARRGTAPSSAFTTPVS